MKYHIAVRGNQTGCRCYKMDLTSNQRAEHKKQTKEGDLCLSNGQNGKHCKYFKQRLEHRALVIKGLDCYRNKVEVKATYTFMPAGSKEQQCYKNHHHCSLERCSQ